MNIYNWCIFFVLAMLSILGLHSLISSKVVKALWNEFWEALKKVKLSLGKRWCLGSVLLTELVVVLSSMQVVFRNYSNQSLPLKIVVFIFVGCIVNIILLFIFGIISVLFIKATDFMVGLKDSELSQAYMFSFLILILVACATLIPMGNPLETKIPQFLSLAGLTVSVLLNIKIFIKIVKSPDSVSPKSNKNKATRDAMQSLIFGAIFLVLMTIFDFSLGVWTLSSSDPGAYKGKISGLLDSLYYTVTTFTTIGYGDIKPVTPIARVLAIIIAITSVFYLIIFINKIMTTLSNGKGTIVDACKLEDKEMDLTANDVITKKD